MKSEAAAGERPFNLAAYEELARARLPQDVYDYYAGGAEDEVTLRANRSAFAEYALRPRVLVDVSRIDTSVTLLDEVAAAPVLLAPTAFQRLADVEGELATVRAAAAARTILVASTLSTYPIEEITAAADARVWFQLYVFRERSITEALVRRAEAAGCRAIVLTVTVPVQGNRERDAHNRFRLPVGVEMANFRGLRQAHMPDAARGSGLFAFIASEFDPSLTWEAVSWLRSITRLPIVIKGVMCAADARLAVEHGAAAVIVSNHGGRQLDSAEATLHALRGVVEGAAGSIPVLLDGGVRRGTDVVKALLLGARAVLIGRPCLWGLSVGGQAGVEHVLELLQDEVARTMALVGAPTIRDLEPGMLTPS